MSEGKKRLWEVSHPYYCAEVEPEEYWAWGAFMEELGDSDPDLNLLVRWDWIVRESLDEQVPPEYLELAFLLQRKGVLRTIRVAARRDEEPEMRIWLVNRLRTIESLWHPLLPDYSGDSE